MTATTNYTFDLTGREKLLSARDAVKVFEKITGRRPHHSKVRRLVKKGPHGLPLPSVVVGSQRFTSAEAIRWWIQATTAIADAARDKQPIASIGAPLSPGETATLRKFGIAPPVAAAAGS